MDVVVDYFVYFLGDNVCYCVDGLGECVEIGSEIWDGDVIICVE